MKWVLLVVALLTSTAGVSAETALSVDQNALWRVDLSTHRGELISSLGTPDPWFWCQTPAVSSTGLVRCAVSGVLYDIRPGAAQPLALLPKDMFDYPPGLAFDAEDRLWWTTAAQRTLWQLDPTTGAVIGSKPLALEGFFATALAAWGNRLFVFTGGAPRYTTLLEEIDPSTGASLSAIDVGALGIDLPIDVDFDSNGDLWFTEATGSIITGMPCLSFGRLHLSPPSIDRVWDGCILIHSAPYFTNIDAIAGEVAPIAVPALSASGAVALILLMAAVACRRLRLSKLPG